MKRNMLVWFIVSIFLSLLVMETMSGINTVFASPEVSISASPTSGAWATRHDLTLSVLGFDSWHSGRRAWTTSPNPPSSSSSAWVTFYPSGWNYNISQSRTTNGSWYLHVEARKFSTRSWGDSRNATRTFGPYRVDTSSPTATITSGGTSCSWCKSHSVSVRFDDTGGSGFRRRRFHWSTSTTTPSRSSSSWTSWNTSSTLTTSRSSTGQWYLHLSMEDHAGNYSTRRVGPYRIDTTNPTSPTLSITQTWTNSNVSFSISGGSDSHSGLSGYQYKIGSGSWTSGSSGTVTTTGETTVSARSVDAAGNVSSSVSHTARIDKTQPDITIDIPSSGWVNSLTVTPSYTDSGGSGLKRRLYQWSTSTVIPSDLGTYLPYSSGTLSPPSQTGTWYLYSYAEDNAGNNRFRTFGPYQIDQTAPTATITSGGTSCGWRQSHSVSVNFSDSGGSGFSRRRLHWSTSTTTPIYGSSLWSSWSTSSALTTSRSSTGEWYLHLSMEDHAGNYSTRRVGPYKIDTTNPTSPALSMSESWTNGNVDFSVSGGYDEHSGVNSYQYKIASGDWVSGSSGSVTSEGQTAVSARAVDVAGNIGPATSRTARIDRTRPEISIDTASSGWVPSLSVTPSYTDSDSGVKYSLYQWSTLTDIPSDLSTYLTYTSGTISPPSQGETWYLYTYAEDNAGNNRFRTFGPYNVDSTAPTITVNPTERGWSSSTINVSVTFQDNLSGVAEKQYAWSASTSRPTTWQDAAFNTITVPQAANGSWYLHLRAKDYAGNDETYVVHGLYRKDDVPPTIDIDIADCGWVPELAATPAFTDDHSGIKANTRKYCWYNGDYIPALEEFLSYTGGTISPPAPGIWYLELYVEDNAGHSTRKTYGPYSVDTTAPTITVNPTARDWDSSTINVSVTFQDNLSGIAEKQYAWSTSTSRPTTWQDVTASNDTITVPQPSDGKWYLHLRAVDNAGNETHIWPGLYRKDSVPPEIAVSMESSNWVDSVTVTPAFTDLTSGVAFKGYYWSNGIIPVTDEHYEIFSGGPLTLDSPGIWYLYLRVRDHAGNETNKMFGPYKIGAGDPPLHPGSISLTEDGNDIFPDYVLKGKKYHISWEPITFMGNPDTNFRYRLQISHNGDDYKDIGYDENTLSYQLVLPENEICHTVRFRVRAESDGGDSSWRTSPEYKVFHQTPQIIEADADEMVTHFEDKQFKHFYSTVVRGDTFKSTPGATGSTSLNFTTAFSYTPYCSHGLTNGSIRSSEVEGIKLKIEPISGYTPHSIALHGTLPNVAVSDGLIHADNLHTLEDVLNSEGWSEHNETEELIYNVVMWGISTLVGVANPVAGALIGLGHTMLPENFNNYSEVGGQAGQPWSLIFNRSPHFSNPSEVSLAAVNYVINFDRAETTEYKIKVTWEWKTTIYEHTYNHDLGYFEKELLEVFEYESAVDYWFHYEAEYDTLD